MRMPRGFWVGLAALALAASVDGSAPVKVIGGKAKAGPIRVLVPRIERGEQALVSRLKELTFDVVFVDWSKVEPAKLKDIDVIVLPTQWAARPEPFKHFEERSGAFLGFVESGGGLLVCQPNPPLECTPKLLPYPITFRNGYDDRAPERVHVGPAHFITADLSTADLPFPADPMISVDRRYQVLAKQKSTDWASLAVCTYGDGRVVVQTANENRGATIPIPDEILRRMIVWAANADKR